MEPYSVLMSVYQKEKPAHLRSALQSLLWQTIPPEEILLVCDGPMTEDLDRVIEEFLILQPALLRTLRLPRNQGLGAALNAGLARCKNELVARMDSDDVSMPERMERQLERMEACSDISVLGGQIMEFREDVENLMGCRNVPEADAEIRKFLKKRNPMNHVTVMFRKSHILEAGGYPEFSGPGFEDYYLWAKLLARGRKLENIPQICCRVRVNEGQYSRRGGLAFFSNARKVQQFLLQTGQIHFLEYLRNLSVWFFSAVVLSSAARRWLCVKLLRSPAMESTPPLGRILQEDRCHETSGYQS